MKTVDLTTVLKNYTKGWVALNEKREVVLHAPTFAAVCRKAGKTENLILIPAAKNYFGFVTAA